jgi:lysophospholipase L1-like esterase
MKQHVFHKLKKKSSLILLLIVISIICVGFTKLFKFNLKNNSSHFEDNSENNKNINFFFNQIDSIQTNKKNVRIAFFGDSFVEGDILTGELRKLLQGKFGGNGVGFVPLASQTSGFRSTIRHTHKNILAYNVVFNHQLNLPFAAGGYYFTPKINNAINYNLHKPVNKIRLFYQSATASNFFYSTTLIKDKKIVLPPTNTLSNFDFNEKNIKSLHLKLSCTNSTSFYGLSFEDTIGITLDNFGLRSNSGIGIGKITDKKHREFDSLQDYKLIVLQYGLNATSKNQKNFTAYHQKMKTLIERIKKNYPNAIIILFSVSDRCVLQNGKLCTMNSIPLMVDTQRKIAQQTGIVFWNLFQAMGGPNSIVKFAKSKPSLAAGDYTHLTHKGGEYIARIFYNELMLEYERYKSIKSIKN